MIFGGSSTRVLDYSLTTSIIYKKITNKNDMNKLQKNLDTLGKWAVENGMKINAGKSKAVRFTRVRVKNRLSVTKKIRKRAAVNTWNNLTKRFKLGGPSKLHRAESLQGTALFNACSKKKKQKYKYLAYTSLVCPILEYGSACWDPYSDGQISALDRVQ